METLSHKKFMNMAAKKIVLRIVASILMLIVTYIFCTVNHPSFLRGVDPLASIYYSLIWGVGSIGDAFGGVSSCVCGDTGGYLLGMEIVGYFTAAMVVLQVLFNRIFFLILWAGGITFYMHRALSAAFDFRSDSFVAFAWAMFFASIPCMIHFRFKDRLYKNRTWKAAIVYAALIIATIYGKAICVSSFCRDGLVSTTPIVLALLAYLLVWVISKRKINRLLESIAIVHCIVFLTMVYSDFFFLPRCDLQ